MMGDVVHKVSIEKILEAVGVSKIVKANPLNYSEAKAAVESVLDEKGVRVVIFKSPCIAVAKPVKAYQVEAEKCVSCKQCIREIGCPAIVVNEGKVQIEPSLCYGCGLCSQICKFGAIKEVKRHG